MQEYAHKPEKSSLDSNSKSSGQPPISEILQAYKNGTLQRMSVDEEELLQAKTRNKSSERETLQRYTEYTHRDKSRYNSLIQGVFDTPQRKGIEDEELLQGKFESSSSENPVQRVEKPNNTGLPDNLKSGIENLSGYSLDDVKVHYNSDKPAQLSALAYAQGTDIHVAPGQEQHLPHEAWHVVQQKQGRVQPTMQMQGVDVNDNAGLERESDVMGNKAAFIGVQRQKSVKFSPKINSDNPILQGIWEEGLAKNDMDMLEKLKAKYPVGAADIKQWRVRITRESPTRYSSLEEVAKALGISTEVVSDEQNASVPIPQEIKLVEEPVAIPVQDKQVIETSIPQAKSSIVKRQEPKPEKKHKTVSEGGTELYINYVWVGDKPLGKLEKYNIYSWRALGHKVTIYLLNIKNESPSAATLGLEEDDATLIKIRDILPNDGTEDVPDKQALTDVRAILNRWINEIDRMTEAMSLDEIFNIVDLLKSYIGGTRQGIVLDMKVGPSVHLQDYVPIMQNHFISYSRGGSTASGLPENQCIGTMSDDISLRETYAREFNKRGKRLGSIHQKGMYNSITGYHGQAWMQAKHFDVATSAPPLKRIDEYPVSEPGEMGHGPFRVYKNASDQTHREHPLTKPEDVERIEKEVLDKEFSGIANVYTQKMKTLVGR